MKKFGMLALSLAMFWSCSDDKSGADLMPENNTISVEDSVVTEEEVGIKNLICLWDKASMYSEPVKPNKWLKAIAFGRTLAYLADTNIESKTYYKVRLPEGDEGWVNGYLLEPNAKVMIVTKKFNYNAAPDPLTIQNKFMEMGDLIVVDEEKVGGFYKFITQEKKIIAYMNQEGFISEDPKVLEAGQILMKILSMQNTEEKRESLIDFQTNAVYMNTPFAESAKNYLREIETESEEIEEAIEDKILQAN